MHYPVSARADCSFWVGECQLVGCRILDASLWFQHPQQTGCIKGSVFFCFWKVQFSNRSLTSWHHACFVRCGMWKPELASSLSNHLMEKTGHSEQCYFFLHSYCCVHCSAMWTGSPGLQFFRAEEGGRGGLSTSLKLCLDHLCHHDPGFQYYSSSVNTHPAPMHPIHKYTHTHPHVFPVLDFQLSLKNIPRTNPLFRCPHP